MTDFQPQTNFEIPKPSAFSGNPTRTLLIVLGVVLFCCVCIACAFGVFGTSIGTAITAKAPIEEIMDTFMQRMEAKDIDGAYALFSERARRQIGIEKLSGLIAGNNYVLFSGYQRIEVQNVKITNGFNTNPDVPQGTVANVTGIIYYEGNFTGTFTATLEKEGDAWMLDGVNVTVPPDKFSP